MPPLLLASGEDSLVFCCFNLLTFTIIALDKAFFSFGFAPPLPGEPTLMELCFLVLLGFFARDTSSFIEVFDFFESSLDPSSELFSPILIAEPEVLDSLSSCSEIATLAI